MVRRFVSVFVASTLLAASAFAKELTSGTYAVEVGGTRTHSAAVDVKGARCTVTFTDLSTGKTSTFTFDRADVHPVESWVGKGGTLHESSRGGHVVGLPGYIPSGVMR